MSARGAVFPPELIELMKSVLDDATTMLPEAKRTMIIQLADNHARHIWLQQEGAYHLGLAVGRRLRTRPA